jgi:hypothetical protein
MAAAAILMSISRPRVSAICGTSQTPPIRRLRRPGSVNAKLPVKVETVARPVSSSRQNCTCIAIPSVKHPIRPVARVGFPFVNHQLVVVAGLLGDRTGQDFVSRRPAAHSHHAHGDPTQRRERKVLEHAEFPVDAGSLWRKDRLQLRTTPQTRRKISAPRAGAVDGGHVGAVASRDLLARAHIIPQTLRCYTSRHAT